MWQVRVRIRDPCQRGICTRTSIFSSFRCLGTIDMEDRGFDLPTFVDAAFKELRSDVHLTAQLMIGVCKISSFWYLFIHVIQGNMLLH